jgi:hypothetical protein
MVDIAFRPAWFGEIGAMTSDDLGAYLVWLRLRREDCGGPRRQRFTPQSQPVSIDLLQVQGRWHDLLRADP